MFIYFCNNHDSKAANTFFQNSKDKTATYMKVGTTRADTIQRSTHEQLDYIIVPKRWWNSIKNIESDSKANINSDHYPLWCTIKLN